MPIPIYRERYSALFGVGIDQLWATAPPETTGVLPFSGKSISLDRVSSLILPESYDHADFDYLASVHGHIKNIVSLDNRFGGTDLFRLSARFFRTLHGQIGAGAFDSRIETDLYAATGELAEVVGWLAYDAQEHDLVRRMNQESLYFSRLAGDRSIELLTLQNASMHAASVGRASEALAIARSVLEGSPSLSPRLQALFLTRKARALALAGDESALPLLSQARNLFEEGTQSGDPAWAWWIDERELSWQEAMAMRDLGKAGDALERFEYSVQAGPSTGARSQYIHQSYLLQAQVEAGDWGAVERSIQAIAPLIPDVASTRTTDLLGAVVVELGDKAPTGIRPEGERLKEALAYAPI